MAESRLQRRRQVIPAREGAGPTATTALFEQRRPLITITLCGTAEPMSRGGTGSSNPPSSSGESGTNSSSTLHHLRGRLH